MKVAKNYISFQLLKRPLDCFVELNIYYYILENECLVAKCGADADENGQNVGKMLPKHFISVLRGRRPRGRAGRAQTFQNHESVFSPRLGKPSSLDHNDERRQTEAGCKKKQANRAAGVPLLAIRSFFENLAKERKVRRPL